MISDGFTYVAVLLFMAGVLVTLEKKATGALGRFFRFVPSVVLCYLVAFLIMKRFIGSDAWKGLGALCGSWIGGSGNMVAVQAALNIGEADMGYALVIDSIDYSLWVMFLLWAIQLAPRFNRWTHADTTRLDAVSARLEDEARLNTRPPTLQSLLLLCKLLRLDLFTAGVASLANIGGTASAPVLAGAYAGSLVPVGILMALMGYVVGTPLATLCANIMKQLA